VHTTRISLDPAIRRSISLELGQALANGIDLGLQIKHAHWNVKGPAFIAIHELFDAIHGVIAGHVDDLAERLAALGGTADGTVGSVAARSELTKYPITITSGAEHLEAIACALAAFGARTRMAIDRCDDLGDKVTADLFNEVTGSVDKQLWLVEAHLQSKA
jgi:starvation-inducible DNA-binding protein